MIVRIDKSFQKDISRINDPQTRHAIFDMIESIQGAEDLSSIKNLKKLTGYKEMYRIRLGNYRIGLKLTKGRELILIRFLHRKDIYKRWP